MIGIYSRISLQKDGSTSVEYQEKRGIDFANSKGLPYQLYSDKSVSGGAKIEDRPEFKRLLDDIESGRIKSIYISNNDRAARQETTWFMLVDLLLKNDIDLYENGELIDLNDPSVTLVQGMKALVAANFRRETGRKQKVRLLQNAKEGKVHGAVTPYGYSKDDKSYLVIDEEEAKIVKLIYKMFLDGGSINGIASYLTDNGVPTKFEKMGGKRTYTTPLTGHKIERDNALSEWSRTVIRKILQNPIYKGVRVWKQGKGKTQEVHYFDLPHLAIVGATKWEKVNKSYLKKKGAIKGKVNEHKYLLPPLIECTCGELFYGHSFSSTRAYYKCRSYRKRNRTCKSKAQPIKPFDDLITCIVFGGLYEKIKEQLDNSEDQGGKQRKRLEGINKEIEKLEKSQKRINNIYADGDFTKEEYRVQKERLQLKHSDLNVKKANIEQVLGALEEPKNILQGLEDDIITPFFDKLDEIGYPYDTTYANAIKDKFEEIFKGQLALTLPFEIKQNAFRKYIQKILVEWDAKNNVTIIEVSYKLPIEKQKYIVDSTFLVGVEYDSRSTVYVNKERADYQTDKTNEKKFKALAEIELS